MKNRRQEALELIERLDFTPEKKNYLIHQLSYLREKEDFEEFFKEKHLDQHFTYQKKPTLYIVSSDLG